MLGSVQAAGQWQRGVEGRGGKFVCLPGEEGEKHVKPTMELVWFQ